MAYAIVDQVNPSEKFIQIFYQGTMDSVFYATFYYPKKDCMISLCPGNDPRLLAFEFAHQVQTFYNEHRGSNPRVEIIDTPGQAGPTDQLIKNKFNSVSNFYQ